MAPDLFESLEARLQRWILNSDRARISVPLGELRSLLNAYHGVRSELDELRPARPNTQTEQERP